ncbi:hypothetical protein MLD38_024767 [Melastoma candidum]|uniref:Uncharacterized protein n=1 Tax=Melastoma candidum TaxID=119954 RepID=A0ACB9NUW6_9MYRT|nr:hypothetical protein MLD38_024767 [Melastoma candidum]
MGSALPVLNAVVVVPVGYRVGEPYLLAGGLRPVPCKSMLSFLDEESARDLSPAFPPRGWGMGEEELNGSSGPHEEDWTDTHR